MTQPSVFSAPKWSAKGILWASLNTVHLNVLGIRNYKGPGLSYKPGSCDTTNTPLFYKEGHLGAFSPYPFTLNLVPSMFQGRIFHLSLHQLFQHDLLRVSLPPPPCDFPLPCVYASAGAVLGQYRTVQVRHHSYCVPEMSTCHLQLNHYGRVAPHISVCTSNLEHLIQQSACFPAHQGPTTACVNKCIHLLPRQLEARSRLFSLTLPRNALAPHALHVWTLPLEVPHGCTCETRWSHHPVLGFRRGWERKRGPYLPFHRLCLGLGSPSWACRCLCCPDSNCNLSAPWHFFPLVLPKIFI